MKTVVQTKKKVRRKTSLNSQCWRDWRSVSQTPLTGCLSPLFARAQPPLVVVKTLVDIKLVSSKHPPKTLGITPVKTQNENNRRRYNMEYEVGKILENVQQQLEAIWRMAEENKLRVNGKVFEIPKNDKEEP